MSDSENPRPANAGDIHGKKLAELKLGELTLTDLHVLGKVVTDPFNGDDAPSDSDLTGRAKELYDRAYALETQLSTADENGLFLHQKPVHMDEILNMISSVYTISLQSPLTAEKYSEAIKTLDDAQDRLDTAIQEIG